MESTLTDSYLLDPRPSDIVVAVLGIAGCGKSSFINSCLDAPGAVISHGVVPTTKYLKHFCIQSSQGSRVILLDTPGFDNGSAHDRNILDRISRWLRKSYPTKPHMKLSAVLYLHDISQPRVTRHVFNYLPQIKKLCGSARCCERVILCTTMWDSITEPEGTNREEELKRSFWREPILRGSSVQRVAQAADRRRIVERFLKGGVIVRDQGALLDQDQLRNKSVVLLMGTTGSGKSTFIQQYLDPASSIIEIGGGLRSTTKTVTPYFANTMSTVLVDTPGFDSAGVTDSEILDKITKWMESNLSTALNNRCIIILMRDEHQEYHSQLLVHLTSSRAKDSLVKVVTSANPALIAYALDQAHQATFCTPSPELTQKFCRDTVGAMLNKSCVSVDEMKVELQRLQERLASRSRSRSPHWLRRFLSQFRNPFL